MICRIVFCNATLYNDFLLLWKGVIAPGKRDRRVTGLALQQFAGGRG